MPRVARKKSNEAFYHIMCRSISEVELFPSGEDKLYYISLLKKYCDKYHSSIYAYCILDNHAHLYLDPKGMDVSTFMHGLNSAYVAYFNRRYKRHGHLFQGRFASCMVTNDTYSLTLSAYIHNNAKDIPGFNGREDEYPYSSYGIYTGKRNDSLGLVDTTFILQQFSSNPRLARDRYKAFVSSMRDTGIMKEINTEIARSYTENEYRSEKKYIIREKSPATLLHKVCKLMGEDRPQDIRLKYRRDKIDLRKFCAYVMRVLCGCTYKEICETIGNISLSGAVRLTGEGYRLYKEEKLYNDAFLALM